LVGVFAPAFLHLTTWRDLLINHYVVCVQYIPDAVALRYVSYSHIHLHYLAAPHVLRRAVHVRATPRGHYRGAAYGAYRGLPSQPYRSTVATYPTQHCAVYHAFVWLLIPVRTVVSWSPHIILSRYVPKRGFGVITVHCFRFERLPCSLLFVLWLILVATPTLLPFTRFYGRGVPLPSTPTALACVVALPLFGYIVPFLHYRWLPFQLMTDLR